VAGRAHLAVIRAGPFRQLSTAMMPKVYIKSVGNTSGWSLHRHGESKGDCCCRHTKGGYKQAANGHSMFALFLWDCACACLAFIIFTKKCSECEQEVLRLSADGEYYA